VLVLYADVEYFGEIYLDAELVDGVWFFEDMYGGVYSFVGQRRVNPQNPPEPERRHPATESGHVILMKHW
jgi:hypothetical protein